MPDDRHQTSPEATIRALAERYQVHYVPTDSTRLSGDDVVFDETERLLIALQRAGHLSRTDAVLLQAEYLRHAKS